MNDKLNRGIGAFGNENVPVLALEEGEGERSLAREISRNIAHGVASNVGEVSTADGEPLEGKKDALSDLLAYQQSVGYISASWADLQERYKLQNNADAMVTREAYKRRYQAARSVDPDGVINLNLGEREAAGRELSRNKRVDAARSYARMLGCPEGSSAETLRAALNLFRRREAERQFRGLIHAYIEAVRATKNEGVEWDTSWDPQLRLMQRGFSSENVFFSRFLVGENSDLDLQKVRYPTRFNFVEGPLYTDDMEPIQGGEIGCKIYDYIDQPTMRRIADEIVAETEFSHSDFDFLKRPVQDDGVDPHLNP